MISRELERSLSVAVNAAREMSHQVITVEHLLAALLDNPSAAKTLRACGGNLEAMRRDLKEYIDTHVRHHKKFARAVGIVRPAAVRHG